MSVAGVILLWGSFIFFSSRSMPYIVSDSWIPKQCQGLVTSCGEDLKSNQLVIGYVLNVCANIAPVFHTGRSPLWVVAGLVVTFLHWLHAKYLPIL